MSTILIKQSIGIYNFKFEHNPKNGETYIDCFNGKENRGSRQGSTSFLPIFELQKFIGDTALNNKEALEQAIAFSKHVISEIEPDYF